VKYRALRPPAPCLKRHRASTACSYNNLSDWSTAQGLKDTLGFNMAAMAHLQRALKDRQHSAMA
jgi:hypothetical protein